MLTSESVNRIAEVQRRLQEAGVVDFKFFKTPDYKMLDVNAQVGNICSVLEAMLDKEWDKAPPFNDSVRGICGDSQRGLPVGSSPTENRLSPIARCGGEPNGDHYERNEKGGTSAS